MSSRQMTEVSARSQREQERRDGCGLAGDALLAFRTRWCGRDPSGRDFSQVTPQLDRAQTVLCGRNSLMKLANRRGAGGPSRRRQLSGETERLLRSVLDLIAAQSPTLGAGTRSRGARGGLRVWAPIGKVKPQSSCSSLRFCIDSPRACSVQVKGGVIGDNVPEPIAFELVIPIEVTERPVSHGDMRPNKDGTDED